MSRSLREHGIEAVATHEVTDNSLEAAIQLFAKLPGRVSAIVGIGGGKALDVAKYVGFLARLPYYSVPTSLSNDGFCSPQSSLTVEGRRKSLASALPFGVVIDTAVCLAAPRILTLSGVGDLVAKFTAVRDWKLAFLRIRANWLMILPRCCPTVRSIRFSAIRSSTSTGCDSWPRR